MPIVCQRSVAFPKWMGARWPVGDLRVGRRHDRPGISRAQRCFMQVMAFLLTALAVKWSLEVWRVYRTRVSCCRSIFQRSAPLFNGRLTQAQVDGLNALMTAINAARVTDPGGGVHAGHRVS